MLMNLKVCFTELAERDYPGETREPEFPMMEASEFASMKEFVEFNTEQCMLVIQLHPNNFDFYFELWGKLKMGDYKVDVDPYDSSVLLITVVIE